MYSQSLLAALFFVLLGMATGAAIMTVGRGVTSWTLVWMLNGLGYGVGLGSMEGLFYSLVWSLPGTIIGMCWALFLWTRSERMHEATAQRAINSFVALIITPVLFAIPMGIMGFLDLGFTDDVFGVMAMAAIMGSIVGLGVGLKSVEEKEVRCPTCGTANKVPLGMALEKGTCRRCHDFLENPVSQAAEGRGGTGEEEIAEVRVPSLRGSIGGLIGGMLLGVIVQVFVCVPGGALLGACKGAVFAWVEGIAGGAAMVDGMIQGAWVGGFVGVGSGALIVAFRKTVDSIRALRPFRSAKCAVCGTENRVPRDREVEEFSCLNCQNRLVASRPVPRWIWGLGLTLVLLIYLLVESVYNPDRELFTLRGSDYWINSLSFSPDGRYLASGDRDEKVFVWDLVTGEEVHSFYEQYEINSVAFSADGKYLAYGMGDDYVRWQEENNKVTLRELSTGRIVERLEGHRSAVHAVAFSADGKYLASGSADSTVILWDVERLEPVRTIGVQEGAIRYMRFSADGEKLALDGEGNSIGIWDVASGEKILSLEGHAGGVTCVAFSVDGMHLASGGLDYKVKVWEVETGELKQEIGGYDDSFTFKRQGHGGYVLSVVFSPDGRYLVSGGEYRTIRFWDWHTGEQVRVLGGAEFPFTLIEGGHADGVQALVFSPDGRYLVSGDEDGLVKFWRVE